MNTLCLKRVRQSGRLGFKSSLYGILRPIRIICLRKQIDNVHSIERDGMVDIEWLIKQKLISDVLTSAESLVRQDGACTGISCEVCPASHQFNNGVPCHSDASDWKKVNCSSANPYTVKMARQLVASVCMAERRAKRIAEVASDLAIIREERTKLEARELADLRARVDKLEQQIQGKNDSKSLFPDSEVGMTMEQAKSLKRGDTVTVIRSYPHYAKCPHDGTEWRDSWASQMDEYVGKQLKVMEDYTGVANGVALDVDGHPYNIPWFALKSSYRVRKEGFAIICNEGLGYAEYTYFTHDKGTAEGLLEEVRAEHPDMQIVPATLTHVYANSIRSEQDA